MRGIYRCTIGLTNDSKTGELVPMTDEQLKIRNQKFMDAGFIPNYELDGFVVDGFGAWMGDITPTDELNGSYFQPFFELGYNIVLGPKGPNSTSDSVGIFCKNYKELLKNEGTKNCKYSK